MSADPFAAPPAAASKAASGADDLFGDFAARRPSKPSVDPLDLYNAALPHIRVPSEPARGWARAAGCRPVPP